MVHASDGMHVSQGAAPRVAGAVARRLHLGQARRVAGHQGGVDPRAQPQAKVARLGCRHPLTR